MSLPVCKFYNSYKCKFGRHCKFIHSESQKPPPLQHCQDHIQDDLLRSQSPTQACSPVPLDNFSTRQQNHNDASVSGFSEEPSPSSVSFEKLQTSQNAAAVLSVSKQSKQHRPISEQKKPCVHFARNGYCMYGRSCRFAHISKQYHESRNHFLDSATVSDRDRHIPPRFRRKEPTRPKLESSDVADDGAPDDNSTLTTLEDVFLRNENKRHSAQKRGKINTKACRYFMSGFCRSGQRCSYSHVCTEIQTEAEASVQSSAETQDGIKANVKGGMKKQIRKSYASRAFVPPTLKQEITMSELETDGTECYRRTDKQYIERRFDKKHATLLEDEEDYKVRVVLSPSDPDWPFDIQNFDVIITLPKDYPKEMMAVVLPQDQDLPETVRRYIEVSVKEWMEERFTVMSSKGKVELAVRPFLRWFDRNIEELSTEALKQFKRELVAQAAGMEFIPAHKLRARLEVKNKSESSEGTDEEQDSGTDNESEDDDSEDYETESTEEDDDTEVRRSQNLDPQKKGTELELKNLQLKEKVAALMFEKLKLVLQCSRCKSHSELLVPQGKVMSLQCGKCNHNQFVHYRAALMHQFSSVVGYLDLDGCHAFDLIFQDCRLLVTCMNCSKQTKLDGLVSGQLIDGWCQACNARFKFATEAAKFSNLAPSVVDTTNQKVEVISSSKSKKPPKDPAIREGCPLPEFGTCKHYKQSYRWLRFPCCGKAYPCDVCHDKKEDHEMQLANRMICGHCCKEQNYSAARPCNGCKQNLTKVRSAHWEGGSGCRDKISMSRSDQQKYKGMSKTVSNHKKTLGVSKKNIKLRRT